MLRLPNSWLVILTVGCFSFMSAAETLKLEDEMQTEELPNNKVWAKIRMKNGAETCALWKAACPENNCKSCVVKYLTREEREAYRLIWSERKKRWLDSDGRLYDTEEAVARMLEKEERTAEPRDAQEKKPLRVPRTVCDIEAEKAWGTRPGIWVIDTEGNFYTSVEQAPGKFHHSSFMAGGLVKAAGQIVIKKGEIVHINNSSGHYKPDQRSLKRVFKYLHVDKGSKIYYDPHSSLERSSNNMRESAPSLHSSLATMPDDNQSHHSAASECYSLYDVNSSDYTLYRSNE